MSEELKPCPFCADEMKLDPGAVSFASGPGLVYVSCDCGAMGAGGKTRAEAIEVWNRRTPPAVTAKPDLAAPVEQASAEPTRFMDEIDAANAGIAWLDERVTRDTRRVYMTDEMKCPMPRVKWVAHFDHFDRLTHAILLTRDAKNWTQLTRVDVAAASIPPQQAPDPIYLIRPKAGGPTWTECISEQSHDAAMRLGVYESRVVVEVGAAAGSVRDAALEAAARIAMDGPLLESAGESLYLNDNCKAMALMVANRIRDLKGKAQ